MTRPKKNSQISEDLAPIKKLRLKAKLSQEGLARDIGVAVSTIRRWEKGLAEPTMTVAQMGRFCQAVNREFEELPEELTILETAYESNLFNRSDKNY